MLVAVIAMRSFWFTMEGNTVQPLISRKGRADVSPLTNFRNAKSHCLLRVVRIIEESNGLLLVFIPMLVAVVIVVLVAMVIFFVH